MFLICYCTVLDFSLCCEVISHLYFISIHAISGLCLNLIFLAGEKGECWAWSSGSPSPVSENYSLKKCCLEALSIFLFTAHRNAWNNMQWMKLFFLPIQFHFTCWCACSSASTLIDGKKLCVQPLLTCYGSLQQLVKLL